MEVHVTRMFNFSDLPLWHSDSFLPLPDTLKLYNFWGPTKKQYFCISPLLVFETTFMPG